ncbi:MULTISPECIES: phage/plasmid primase, P4 family [Cyanophyceae]|uniref:phage/plasmid primase, P4 family n=1 Tax=Cyanophyceae TaxID=3028117 RepID=UPI0016836859|nr:phage/plasmid primase, P4 family [Trichocoleus sp. FACHB-69]MBD1930441.1 hypothetical protein [Trichocoleus sp. FACHB-69]
MTVSLQGKHQGAYKCWTNQCDSALIRETIAPLNQKQSGDRFPKVIHTPKRQPAPVPPPIPEGGINLVKLAAPATDSPEPTRRRDRTHGEVVEIRYDYSDHQWTIRKEWHDSEKGRIKRFTPWHRDSEGVEHWVKGDRPWNPYRFDEALEAISATEGEVKALLLVEGEKCVEAARGAGLAAISLQGGSWTDSAILSMAQSLKDLGVILVFLHDIDDTGFKKLKAVEEGCALAGLPCIAINPVKIYSDLDEKHDIVEILQVMDAPEFITRLEQQIHAAVAEREAEINAWTEEEDEGDSQNDRGDRQSRKADKIADEIAEKYRDRLLFNNESKTWMLYESELPGVWTAESDEYIESVIHGIIRGWGISGYGSYSFITNIVKNLRCQLMQRRWVEPAPNKLLPFQDGVLDLAAGELLPHCPSYRFTWALTRCHDSKATDWTGIDAFLTHATGGNAKLKEILICFANAVLLGRADLQKFVHLIGLGGSGKGTFMRLLVDLIGAQNCHSSTLEDLTSNKFEMVNAFKKRLVLFWDEDRGVKQLGKFKSLIGGDWLRGEIKGKQAFQFRYDGMVIVSSNFPVFTGDSSSGMTRRVVTVPLNATTSPSQRRDLNAEFQSELAGFTNHLLNIPSERVTQVLMGLEATPEVDQQFWENCIRTNSVAAWLNDRVIRDRLAITPIGNNSEDSRTLYGDYHTYCRGSGTSPRASKNFSPDLLELCQSILGWKEVQKVHQKTGNAIQGLRLRNDGDRDIPTYDYRLFQAVKGSEGYGEGYGEGSESLQGKILKDGEGKITNSEKKENELMTVVQTEIALTDSNVAVDNPSPPVNSTAGEGFNPSLHPSPHPSPATISTATPDDAKEIEECAKDLQRASDGVELHMLMAAFAAVLDEYQKRRVWLAIPTNRRSELMTMMEQAREAAQPGTLCKVKQIGGTEVDPTYTWCDAVLTSHPAPPARMGWTFQLVDDGRVVELRGSSEWLLLG